MRGIREYNLSIVLYNNCGYVICPCVLIYVAVHTPDHHSHSRESVRQSCITRESRGQQRGRGAGAQQREPAKAWGIKGEGNQTHKRESLNPACASAARQPRVAAAAAAATRRGTCYLGTPTRDARTSRCASASSQREHQDWGQNGKGEHDNAA